MNIELGIKSDCVEYRFSYEWLFALMREMGVTYLQLGTFFEFYSLEDSYFADLSRLAERYGVRIKSIFTAHRELGGFFTGDPRMERVARHNYETLIRVASLLGADFAGSSPGAVYRDHMEKKDQGLACYVRHMHELSRIAKDRGLQALTLEPMSCLAEPPATPEEIWALMDDFRAHHENNPEETVPVYLCADVTHGVANRDFQVIHDSIELFEFCLPWMAEFHFKNTDAIFGSTFGFREEERQRGIIKADEVIQLIGKYESHQDIAPMPVKKLVGYLEIGGPKLGRDYSDHLLERDLRQSIEYLQSCLRTPW